MSVQVRLAVNKIGVCKILHVFSIIVVKSFAFGIPSGQFFAQDVYSTCVRFACPYLHRLSDDRSSAPKAHDQALLASALRADASSMMLCVRALCPEGA